MVIRIHSRYSPIRGIGVQIISQPTMIMTQNKNTLLQKPLALLLDLAGIVLIFGALELDLIYNPTGSYGIGAMQIAGVVAGFTAIIASSFVTPRKPFKQAMRQLPLASATIFGISIILLLINLSGVLIPLRGAGVYEKIEYAGKERSAGYRADEVYAQMNRNAAIDEQYPAYVQRLTQLIFDGTVHYWPESGDPAFRLRVPLRENYLIFFDQLLRGERANYEFCRAERAIERAASVCSQASNILADILGRNRVKAHIVGLEGHVVVRARVDNENDIWWVLDADYGVVIEHDMAAIEADPELIRPFYTDQGYSDAVVDNLVGIYAPEGNQTIDENLQCEGEDHYYLLKWLLPVVGLIPLPLHVLIAWARRKRT